LLDKGNNIGFGSVEDISNKYVHFGMKLNNRFRNDKMVSANNENIDLLEFDVLPDKGELMSVESGIRFDLLFINKRPGINLDVTIYVFALDDTCLFEAGCLISKNLDAKNGTYRVNGLIPPFTLNAGSYKVNLIFGENQAYILWRMNEIVLFDIENSLSDRGANINTPPGYMRPNIKWDVKLVLK